jgi:hypothetical protein
MTAANTYSQSDIATQAPAASAFVIEPSDDEELVVVTRGVYVGGAGSVVAMLAGDSVAVTFSGVPAGAVLPISDRMVMEDSTATGIVGLV